MQLTLPSSSPPAVWTEDPLRTDQAHGRDVSAAPDDSVSSVAQHGMSCHDDGKIETVSSFPARTTVEHDENLPKADAMPEITTRSSSVDVKAAVDANKKTGSRNPQDRPMTGSPKKDSSGGEPHQGSMEDAASVILSGLRQFWAALVLSIYELFTTSTRRFAARYWSMTAAACLILRKLRPFGAALTLSVYELYTTTRRFAARPSTVKMFGWGMLLAFCAILVANLDQLAGAVCDTSVFSTHSFCTLPGTASTEVPIVSVSGSRRVPTGDFFQNADFAEYFDAHKVPFEKLLEHTFGGSALAVDMVKAELGLRKLGSKVLFSNLRGKEEITAVLETMEDDARSIGEKLADFEGGVQTALDSITSNTRRASKSIAAVEARHWTSFFLPQHSRRIRNMVLSEFSNAMRTSEAVLDELTESASEARTHLVKLDQKMRQLERLLESENAASRREYRELSTSLWTTIFGGNRLELAQNGDNQDLLARLESIHDQGQARVKGVLAALMELRVNLAHLHRKVQRTPGRAQRFKGTVNHIGNIAKGVERLQQSRDRYINGGSERRRAK